MERDKVLHYFVGMFIGVVGGFGAIVAHQPMWSVLMWSLLLAAFSGAIKEVYDYLSKKGTPEFMDFLATTAGGASAGFFLLIIHVIY